MINILIAPIHYVAERSGGSEYSRAYDYVEYMSKQKDIKGQVLVGYMKEKRMGNLIIKSFFKKKPEYISNLTRLLFLVWIFKQYLVLSAKNKYDIIWHNGPFALGETFSLVSILNTKKIPFVVGPINTPHVFLGDDESRSMGKKVFSGSYNFIDRILKFVDNKTYSISRVFGYLSQLTLKKAALVLAKENQTDKLIKKSGVSKSFVMNLGVNIPAHKSSSIDINVKGLKLISVSYLVERKRTIDLVLMMNHIVNSAKIKNIKLTIVGDGPQKEKIVEAISYYNLSDYIKITGYIEKKYIYNFYTASELFISTTSSDTMPAMFFEAISTGLPMVTYSCPSISELKSSGVQCQEVEVGDYLKLANIVIKALKNKDKLAESGKKNLIVYKEKYNFDKKMDEFMRILRIEKEKHA